MRNWGTAEDCWRGTGERGWFAPHCHEPLWATIPQALLGKGDCFPECSLLPHTGTITLRWMQKQAGSMQGAACFSPSSGSVLPSQSIHKFLGEAWIRVLCLLCSLLQDKLPPCSLHHAHGSGKPLRWLQALSRLLQWFC